MKITRLFLAIIVVSILISSCRSYYTPDKNKACERYYRKTPKFKA
jgi:hypothetical protein